jgi:glycosyltransferase involved in cell wall biosynthesis
MALNVTARGLATRQAETERPLKILVVGLRGIVDVQGGIETHARMLYPLLARLGCSIEIVQRSPYFKPERRRESWHGIRLSYLWSPTTPGLETAVHTLLGVLYAAVKRPDVLHLHAIGPGFLAPLARCFGLRVVMTHHAADYEREKWGPLAKLVLRAGEWLGVQFANRPIVVSPVLQQDIERRYGIHSTVIPNGAPKVVRAKTRKVLDEFGLEPGRYVLCVARLEPTKRQIDLIEAFTRARLDGWKLVLAGGIETRDAYCERLLYLAARSTNVLLTDYQTGAALRELYTHAGLFVLPSLLEGHPIALLEALSYGLPVLASANAANLAVPLPRDRFFPIGDTQALAALLRSAAADPSTTDAAGRSLTDVVREHYSWRNAAESTKVIYENVARGVPGEPVWSHHG